MIIFLDTSSLFKLYHQESDSEEVDGKEGLRTLDSLQLATVILLKGQLQLAKTADKLLLGFFEAEGLPT